MPIYEYKCPKCGKKVEVLTALTGSQGSDQICSKCLVKMNKIISKGIFRI